MRKLLKKMVVNGEDIYLRAGRRHDFICCDCGLVHQFKFRRTLRGVRLLIWRDNRQTNRTRKDRANANARTK